MLFTSIIIGIAAISGAVGVAKGGKAISDNKEATKTNSRAKNLLHRAKGDLSKARNETKTALDTLGKLKCLIFTGALKKFVTLFKRIKNLDLTGSGALDERSKFAIDKASFEDLKKNVELASSIAGGAGSGLVAGAATAFGAYSLAGTFAAASTGTAIASLSGAAATNATLAFFGGGSLAAGGLGVAGGTAVLGGIVAGPALAIMGLVMGAKASANLDNAYSNLEKAKKAKEEIAVMVTTCRGIREMADLYTDLLRLLELELYPAICNLDRIIREEGTNYKSYSKSSKEGIAAVLALVQATKAMLDTPILNKKGAITRKAGTVAAGIQKKLLA